MFWWWTALVGCGDIGISYYAEVCSDWDFDDQDEAALRLQKQGDSILLFRPGVERACGASFQPEIDAHNRTIQVFELWEIPEAAEECSTCFTPTAELSGLSQRGTYELQWFEGRDSNLPIGVLEVSLSGESTQ